MWTRLWYGPTPYMTQSAILCNSTVWFLFKISCLPFSLTLFSKCGCANATRWNMVQSFGASFPLSREGTADAPHWSALQSNISLSLSARIPNVILSHFGQVFISTLSLWWQSSRCLHAFRFWETWQVRCCLVFSKNHAMLCKLALVIGRPGTFQQKSGSIGIGIGIGQPCKSW